MHRWNRPFASCVVWIVLCVASPATGVELTEQARRLHRQVLVFDAHIHLISRQFYQGGHIGQRYADGHVDLPRMREGGVDAFVLALYVQEEYYPARYETKQFLRLLERALAELEANRKQVELALSGRDIQRIHRRGKIAAVLGLEGTFDVDGDLALLRVFHRLGLRVMQIAAHNWTSNYSDSCCDSRRWGGLNDRGRQLVREMNRLGILIDLSHASDETIEDVLEITNQPVVVTHGGLRSFNDIPRNLPERLAEKIAAKGGLIGVQIGNSFHSRRFYEWLVEREGRKFWERPRVQGNLAQMSIEEIDALLRPSFPSVGPQAPTGLLMGVDEWLSVVDRLIELVGEDHVILGTDFDGGVTPPREIRDVSDLPVLTAAMLKRGYSERRIRKILGENLLRVFSAVTR